MLYHFASLLKPYLSILNVVHYVSFRCVAALFTAFGLSLLFGSWFINISRLVFRSKAREFAPETHKLKDDMPTMGGVFILAVIIITALLWTNLADKKIWIFLLCIVSFGAIGFFDDWWKIRYRKGISARTKFIAQWSVAALISCLLVWWANIETIISLPFFKNIQPSIGYLFIGWAMFILVATSNAVNLTDGLDGLAIGSLIPNFATFGSICYLAGHALLAAYLHIPFAHTAEVSVLGATLVGASLGFLWYNTYPAQIFMGDVGSLSLGAALAYMALVCKQELLLIIAGGLFVVETISVMAQVYSYRYFKKRIFKMAPLHHHFELIGWPESKITARFGIISLLLCLCAIITLKLR